MRLPESLLQEIKAKDDSGTSNSRWLVKSRLASRKRARKQGRIDRKKRKAGFHGIKERLTAEEGVESRSKRARRDDLSTSAEGDNISTGSSKYRMQDQQRETGRLRKSRVTTRHAIASNPKSQVEDDEDTFIAYLEAKLGYRERNGGKCQADDDDGLDLLELADSVVASTAAAGSKSLTQDMESDLEYEMNGEQESEEGEMLGKDSESGEEEWGGIKEVPDEEEEAVSDNSSAQLNASPVFGSSAYIPPRLRKTLQQGDLDSEENVKLTRQLKGLLNRMSEQNLSTILDGVEQVYHVFRRHDVTSTLTRLIINGITSHSILLDSFVVLHAAFVSSLHRLIGVEFAAFFVQTLVIEYERYYKLHQAESTIPNTESAGKEASGLLSLFSELYNFHVVGSELVFDIIRSLLQDELQELNVELLLKLLRSSGQQLRQDDPSALRDIISIVQSKVAGKEDGLSSRTRFMLETLSNLKNNKLRRTILQNQSADSVEKLKKSLSALAKKRHLAAHDALRISLEDLHSSESKGKWWLVGAGWAGDPLVDRKSDGLGQSTNASIEDTANEQLLQLAKRQGMNTDIRRSVFVVLMSSDDYIHACERLSQLNLTEVQQREIVRVLLHCCGNEKTYNPYYTLVCQHLCQVAHAYKITVQFFFWDFLRDLGESNVGGTEVIKNIKVDTDRLNTKGVSKLRLKNIAKAYGWWVAKDSVALTILKPVDFTILKSQGKEFLRELLINVFLSSQAIPSPVVAMNIGHPLTRNRAAIEEIFIKAARVETLAMGLMYFMTSAFRDFRCDGEEQELARLVKWASGIAQDTLRTGLDIIPRLKLHS